LVVISIILPALSPSIEAPSILSETDFSEGIQHNVTLNPDGDLMLATRDVHVVDDFTDGTGIATIKNLDHNATNGEVSLIPTFVRTYAKSNSLHIGECIQQTTDGGYVITGVGPLGVLVVKFAPDGTHLWNNTIDGGNRWERGKSIKQTVDDGFIIAAWSGDNENKYDFWLVKTDNNGNKVWDKLYDFSDNDRAYSVDLTNDGGYVVAGYGDGARVMKTDDQGDEQWIYIYNGPGGEKASCVEQTGDGGFIVAGTKDMSMGTCNAWLCKLDNDGNEEWNRTFGGSREDEAYSVTQTADGGYVLTGYTCSNGAGLLENVWIIKTNANGHEQWSRTAGENGEDCGYSVCQASDGGYVIAAHTGSHGPNPQAWLIQADANGDGGWSHRYDFGSMAHSVINTIDGGFAYTGYATVDGKTRVLFVKTDQDGNHDESTGTLTSANILTEDVHSLDSFRYTVQIPDRTDMKVQFSKDNTDWYDSEGTFDEWDTMNHGGGSIDVSGLGWTGDDFYYRVEFNTESSVKIPVLSEINLTYKTYRPEGYYISPPLDGGDVNVLWKNVRWVGTWDGDTYFKFQFRSAISEEDLAAGDFIGPDGSTTSFYSSTDTPIRDGHNGDRYFQYKVYLQTRDGTKTGILSKVEIELNRQSKVTVSTPMDVQRGNVSIEFTLFDSDDDNVDVIFEYSTNGTVFHPATSINEGLSPIALNASGGGIPHTFTWNSRADLYGIDSSTIYVRVSPSDSDPGISDTVGPFRLDNRAPLLVSVGPRETVDTAEVTLQVTTDEDAYVRWSESNTSFDEMENVFEHGEGNCEHTTTVEFGEGNHEIFVSASDVHGNSMNHGRNITFTVDSKAPANLSILINHGVPYTNSTKVNLSLEVPPDEMDDLDAILISNYPEFPRNEWEPYSRYKDWELILLDGVKTVYLKARDRTGKVSEVFSDSIILDTTPPKLLDRLPNEIQTSKTVTISIHTDEDAFIRWDHTNCSYYAMKNQFKNGDGEKNHSTLFSASEGENTIYLSTMDEHGNALTYGIPLTFKVESKGDPPVSDDTTSDDDTEGIGGTNERSLKIVWVWITIAAFLVISICVIVAMVLLKRRKKNTLEEEPPDPNNVITENNMDQYAGFEGTNVNQGQFNGPVPRPPSSPPPPYPAQPVHYDESYYQNGALNTGNEWSSNPQWQQSPPAEQYFPAPDNATIPPYPPEQGP